MALAWPRRAPHMPWHWMPAWSAALGTANACPTFQGDPKVTHETKLMLLRCTLCPASGSCAIARLKPVATEHVRSYFTVLLAFLIRAFRGGSLPFIA